METMDTESPMADSPIEESDLRSEVAALRYQVWTLLVLLVVVSGTFNIFLWVQMKNAKNDFQEIQQNVTQAAGMEQFINRMAEYGRAHPDFVPILTKYGIGIQPAAPAAPAAPVAPAPKR